MPSFVSITRGNGKAVFPKCEVMDSPLKRARGLMFSRKVALPLFFEFESSGRRRNSIHSVFCPPFDAIFLNERMRVVDIRINVRPYTSIIVPSVACKFLIEAPAFSAKGKKIVLGEKLGARRIGAAPLYKLHLPSLNSSPASKGGFHAR
ncbi:DUF192 domain-containing protein [Candidatus Micrarchaeota archaeon]|nr:DUF192 domain-containing protein [Candidatus Micrarchaeota archaeon]MBI5176892.1 DUF192 domain-containing protein [Candidatus Micrarchaeota archaeon]